MSEEPEQEVTVLEANIARSFVETVAGTSWGINADALHMVTLLLVDSVVEYCDSA